ncbi:MAG: SpoIID/LytB domain-containing protein [Clostridiales bacterium]|nr:SpoIID/LytB domain-containing protein [Clostridiales bacterium]
MRKRAVMTVILLLVPWIISFFWTQARGEVRETRDEIEQAVMQENRGTDQSDMSAKMERVIRIDQGDKVLYRRLEDFLPGVVACQMPDEIDGGEYDPEVWKCQAIIARTYICNLMQRRTEIDEEELDLDYLGETKGLSVTDQTQTLRKLALAETSVKATEGIVMKENEQYILPMFHEMSAGRTRAGGEQFPYLSSVDSSFDTERDGYLQKFIFGKKEFAEKISRVTDAASVQPADLLSGVQMIKKDEAGYVDEIKIGTGTYTGDEVRYSLRLPSPCFQVEEDGDEIRVIVRGRGHGYGLSQSGADSLARKGWGYEEILSYYYKNITLIFE